MEWERIRKRPEDCAGANLVDYDEYAKTFSWAQARGLLDGLPGGGLNIAHEAVDRHVMAGRGDKLALRWIGRDDRSAISPMRRLARRQTGLPMFWRSAALARATGCSRCSAACRNSTSPRSAR